MKRAAILKADDRLQTERLGDDDRGPRIDGAKMTEQPRGLKMTLPAKAENVVVVRHALAGLAEEIGMDEPGLADLKTVVTEACMNVVVHAYQGEPGPLAVEAEPREDSLAVTVSDSGTGIRPKPDLEGTSLRLGLSLIAALSSSFSISGGLDRGTRVEMTVPLRGGGAGIGAEPLAVEEPTNTGTEIVIGRADLLGPVLGRVMGALAARRDLSVDRLADAVLVTDAIASAAPSHFRDGEVHLTFEEHDGGLDLHLGPMADGSAELVREGLAVPEVGGSLEALADELAVEGSPDGDYLVIRFTGAARR